MIGYGDRERRLSGALLHNHVAPSPPDFAETFSGKDRADLLPRKYTQFTQRRPRAG
jgi:hypothetical protein